MDDAFGGAAEQQMFWAGETVGAYDDQIAFGAFGVIDNGVPRFAEAHVDAAIETVAAELGFQSFETSSAFIDELDVHLFHFHRDNGVFDGMNDGFDGVHDVKFAAELLGDFLRAFHCGLGERAEIYRDENSARSETFRLESGSALGKLNSFHTNAPF